jgi:hypothetical protein
MTKRELTKFKRMGVDDRILILLQRIEQLEEELGRERSQRLAGYPGYD